MVEGKRYKINLDGYDFSQLGQNFLQCVMVAFCDHYDYPEYKEGNIDDNQLNKMVFSTRQ